MPEKQLLIEASTDLMKHSNFMIKPYYKTTSQYTKMREEKQKS